MSAWPTPPVFDSPHAQTSAACFVHVVVETRTLQSGSAPERDVVLARFREDPTRYAAHGSTVVQALRGLGDAARECRPAWLGDEYLVEVLIEDRVEARSSTRRGYFIHELLEAVAVGRILEDRAGDA